MTVNQFKENGYCVVKNAISNELRDFVTQYALFDEMQNFSNESMQGAKQVPNAHSKYADPAMETMLLHLHKIMEDNTELELFPTYSYYRVYRPGDDLKPHKDRPSCEISCTLCFNYDYGNENYSWPIFMNGNEVNLEPGDLVIYRGCDLEHWRNQFDLNANDAWHVQGFFHYVDQNGPYKEFRNDKRESIGIKSNNSIIHKKENKKYIQYI
jgi:alkylated DNA repair dioxygenase AlkB